MAITTYTELKAAIAQWLNRTDLTDQIPDFIKLAEDTLNKVLRDTRMVTSTTVSLTTPWRKGAVPTDMIQPVYIEVSGQSTNPLEPVAPEQLIMLRRRMQTAGTPKFYCIMGRFIEVVPSPSSNTTLDITYFQTIPPLASNSTNWLLTYNADVYLWTSLLHAAPFLQDDARTALFGNLVAEQVKLAVQTNTTATLDSMKQPGFSLTSPSDPKPTS
jgi:hypothetical protein